MNMNESPENLDHCVAIIGMAGRFPGAADVQALWQNVLGGKIALKKFTPEEIQASILSEDKASIPYRVEELTSGNWVGAGFKMDDIDMFDASFFGYTPSEAELLDPQQRLFLETSWAAIEDAGYIPDECESVVGIFGGAALSRYFLKNVYSHRDIIYSTRDLTAGIGNEPDYVTNRVAYKLNLTGPAVSVQTACSTSLVAVHLACQSLLTGETDMCLAGGVLVSIPGGGYLYREGSMNSPDGAIRPFDAGAEGTVFSDAGVGMVCLKRLGDALADGDQVYAIIRGTAVGNDGSVKAGYTAPGVAGQKKVVTEAIHASGISPDTIGYMEAHGTGTPLGDPIELSALSQAWRAHTDRTSFCALGSLKPNVGHLATAAGVASLIKAALVVREGIIPPLVNYEKPNPLINFSSSPFYVPTEVQPWKSSDGPRRAAVSSFGIGGTNAHVVLEQAPELPKREAAAGPWTFPLSAKSPEALARQATRLADWLDKNPQAELRDVSFTLQHGRKAFDFRSAAAAGTTTALSEALRALALSGGERRLADDVRVAWMFSGQGTQYVDMACGLHGKFEVFTEVLDDCLMRLARDHGVQLHGLLHSSGETDHETLGRDLGQTANAQPALFIVEYALARQLESFGLQPAAMIGHSLGEYVAACMCGVFRLDAVLALVALRGRLMQSMPAGSMLAVSLDAAAVRSTLGDEMSIAADNAPGTSVVSGTTEAIDRLRLQLEADGHACRPLVTSHAFHSSAMQPIVAEFENAVSRAAPEAPHRQFISNVSGTWITAEQAVDPAYWSAHLLGTVRFREGLQTLAESGCNLFVEIGPGNTLSTFARRTLSSQPKAFGVIETIRHPRENDDDACRFALALGRLWTYGSLLDWKMAAPNIDARRTSLPTYPFERESHWLRAAEETDTEIVQRLTPNQWFSVQSWKRGRRAVSLPSGQDWSTRHVILVGPEQPCSNALTSRLREFGANVFRLNPGERFEQIDEHNFRVLLSDTFQLGLAVQSIVASMPSANRLAFICVPDLDTSAEPQADVLDAHFFDLLAGVVAIADAALDLPPVVFSVSAGGFAVIPGDDLRPVAATAMGVHLCLGHEMPDWASRHVDVSVDDVSAPGGIDLPTLLLTELDALFHVQPPQIGWSDKAAAFRLGARWSADLDAVQLPEPVTTSIRTGGVYLITGGLGGLGLSLGLAFSERGAGVLVLVGRSGLPPRASWESLLANDDETSRRIRAVMAIESSGTKVETFSADVCDASRLSEVVADVLLRHGRLDGAIHAAGVAGAGIMRLKEREDALRVLKPKVFGAHALCTALAANRTDANPIQFVALFSSLFSQIGGMGQVDYAAGNAYLDVYAHFARDRWNLPVISLGWGPWDEVGMAARHGHTASAAKLSGSPLANAHPLVHNEVERRAEYVEFAALLQPSALWMLTDHRLSGTPTMPGTGLLEMVRAGFENLSGQMYATFEEVYFFRPLFVEADAGIEARVRYTAIGDERWTFEVLDANGSGGFAPVASGTVFAASGTVPAFDRSAAGKQCTEARSEFPDGRLPLLSDDGFLTLGRHWDVVHRLDFGTQSVLAQLNLLPGTDDDVVRFPLHPSLLDMATGPITGHLLSRLALPLSGEYLPSSYGRLEQYAPLSGNIQSFVRFVAVEEDGEAVLFDIDISGEHGLVARVERFTLRRVAQSLVRPKLVGAVPSRAWSDGISPSEGFAAFERMIACPGEPHWVVLPLSVNGLLAGQRTELRRRIEDGNRRTGQIQRRSDDDVTPPGTDTEKLLVAVYEKVLGVAPISIHDNFFELGGDSVIGIQIVAQAKTRGLQIKPAQLFEFQTIATLAAVVGAAAVVVRENILTSSQRLRTDTLVNAGADHLQIAFIRMETPLGVAEATRRIEQLVEASPLMRATVGANGTWLQASAAEIVQWDEVSLPTSSQVVRERFVKSLENTNVPVSGLWTISGKVNAIAIGMNAALGADLRFWQSASSALNGSEEAISVLRNLRITSAADDNARFAARQDRVNALLASCAPTATGQRSPIVRFELRYDYEWFGRVTRCASMLHTRASHLALTALAACGDCPSVVLYEEGELSRSGNDDCWTLRAYPLILSSAANNRERLVDVMAIQREAVDQARSVDALGAQWPRDGAVPAVVLSDLGALDTHRPAAAIDWSCSDFALNYPHAGVRVAITVWMTENALHLGINGDPARVVPMVEALDMKMRTLLMDTDGWSAQDAVAVRAAEFRDADISEDDLKSLLSN